MRLDHLLSKENSLKDLLFIMFFIKPKLYGAVAQLARAPALQAGGQEFDSPQLHHIYYNDNIIIGGTLKNI